MLFKQHYVNHFASWLYIKNYTRKILTDHLLLLCNIKRKNEKNKENERDQVSPIDFFESNLKIAYIDQNFIIIL